MAIEKTIIIKGETKQAQKSFDDLGNVIQEQIDITIQFERELQTLEQQLKDTPKGSLQAQKQLKDRIVDLKDAIKDQRISVKELNNERKKQVKTDNLTLRGATKNYGAIQLLDQATGGLATQIRSTVDASRLFNKSLKASRAALIATGIGAFVVALGLVVAYWDDIVEFIGGANKALQKQIDLKGELIKDLAFELEILELQKTTLENQEESTENIKKTISQTLEEQLSLLEAQLLSYQTQLDNEISKANEVTLWERILATAQRQQFVNSKITEEEKQAIEDRKNAVQETIKAIEGIRLRQSAATKEIRDDEQERIKAGITANTKFSEEREKERQAELEFQRELRRLLDEDEQADIDSEDARIERLGERLKLEEEGARKRRLTQLEFDASQKDTDIGRLEAQKEVIKEEEKLINDDIQRKRALYREGTLARTQAEEDFLTDKQRLANEEIKIDNQINANKKKNDEDEAKRKQAIRDAESAALSQSLDIALQLLSNSSEENKKHALRNAYISMFLGVAKGVSLGYPAAIPAVAAALLTGGAAIKSIQAEGQGSASSSSSSFSTPSTSTSILQPQTPEFDLVQGTQGNQIAEALAQTQVPLEAFVVSGSVTTSQELDRNIVEESTI